MQRKRNVNIAPKSMLQSVAQRAGLVITPVTPSNMSRPGVFDINHKDSKPKVVQGPNPNLRPILPKVDDMLGCKVLFAFFNFDLKLQLQLDLKVCNQQMKANLLAFHMEQAHKGASIPVATSPAKPAAKVLGDELKADMLTLTPSEGASYKHAPGPKDYLRRM